MFSCKFDPEANKVTNAYGGFDPNEKGLVQYPKPTNKTGLTTRSQRPSTGYPGTGSGPKSPVKQVFSNPILDPVTRHYRRFIQDPNLWNPTKEDEDQRGSPDLFNIGMGKDDVCQLKQEIMPSICRRHKAERATSAFPRMQTPIDPVHWKSDLFDTQMEKYYLRNIMNEDPYRRFLSDHAESTTPHKYCSEYKQNFSGNPVVSSSGRILGLGRPIDLTETCEWRRNRTMKLRDVIFTHEKEPLEAHLDYKDPKRYNPWPRLEMSYAQMLEGNYRPRPASGVEYSVTTLLPAVSPYSKQWII
ncbi:unnamed protein product [Orchesella dallaii]|uniref:Uncharacterized protein n=1 Tax=Orchesella dallaii TaxID=48710 RepID=A0ABP1QCI6_9HEXA